MNSPTKIKVRFGHLLRPPAWKRFRCS